MRCFRHETSKTLARLGAFDFHIIENDFSYIYFYLYIYLHIYYKLFETRIVSGELCYDDRGSVLKWNYVVHTGSFVTFLLHCNN